MNEIKFRYHFKNRKTGEELKAVLSLDEIEQQAFNPPVFKEWTTWEILSRVLYIGCKDKNKVEMYIGDMVKAQHWNEENKLVWTTGEINYDVDCARYMIGNRTLASTIGASWEIIGHKFEQN